MAKSIDLPAGSVKQISICTSGRGAGVHLAEQARAKAEAAVEAAGRHAGAFGQALDE
jgi:hypothetical protein